VRFVALIFGVTTLTFSALCFVIVGFPLVLKAPEGLTNRSRGYASLLFGGIVEAGGGLLFKGNVRIILKESIVNKHPENIESGYLHPFPFA
jgi:hypothetical protein